MMTLTPDDYFDILVAGMITSTEAAIDMWNTCSDMPRVYNEAVKAYAESLGRQPIQLSNEEKKNAFLRHVLEPIE